MEQNGENVEELSPTEEIQTVQDSPKPLAFLIDFGGGKTVDTQRHKALVEKFQSRHRRGQSLSKLEEIPPSSTVKKPPLSANLPRKSSFHSEGYFSSDEKSERPKNVRAASNNLKSRADLTLPLKHVITNKMTQSYPNANFNLTTIQSPEIELKDISSPELELVSPISPKIQHQISLPSPGVHRNKIFRQYSSPECESHNFSNEQDEKFVDGIEFDFDKSDTVSDAGTYTLDAENYSEEQKARMSIDSEFNIEQVSVMKKAEEYVQSLRGSKTKPKRSVTKVNKDEINVMITETNKQILPQKVHNLHLTSVDHERLSPHLLKSPVTSGLPQSPSSPAQILQKIYAQKHNAQSETKVKLLSPILSPTQNISITDSILDTEIQHNGQKQTRQNISIIHSVADLEVNQSKKQAPSTPNVSITPSVLEPVVQQNGQKQMNHVDDELHNKSFTKILFPSSKAKTGICLEQAADQGCFTSVTSSGAFSRKTDGKNKGHVRQPSLTKSEIQVEAYTDITGSDGIIHAAVTVNRPNGTNLNPNLCKSLSNNSSNVYQNQSVSKNNEIKEMQQKVGAGNEYFEVGAVHGNLALGKVTNLPSSPNLPPSGSSSPGKNSPSKIPSPLHSLSRPRSRNSISSLNIDLSDSSLETESYLKSTQSCINTLQQRLSLDSDQDSDYDNRYNLRLNNETQNLLKNKQTHARHNSFDDRNLKVSNKLEHFQNKNLFGIDQTYTNMLNQYSVRRIQNSPNNSPIRRSSSFSTKNQITVQPKVTNLNANAHSKETNIRNSPNFTRNGSIQRSASTASIRPNVLQLRRSSISSEHQKIDRSQFGDTESSSEEDFDKTLSKKKDLSNLTNTRYNRAFSLRRARLDVEPSPPPKCPNTPEMRRKFQPAEHMRAERAISVDRRPVKTNEVQSRYLQSISKTKSAPSPVDAPKNVPKVNSNVPKSIPNKPQVFSRTDSGRFSMRTSKPPVSNAQKNIRKDGTGKKQSGGRSNSSLSSKEVEFQNWKRRKSYDPMKAAAEGKRKAELAKKQNVMTQSYTGSNQGPDCDSSPSHSSSVHRSQSFHGTAALEQLLSSEEDDLTLSADEGFSPPTPSPCELSPAHAKLRHAWNDRLLH